MVEKLKGVEALESVFTEVFKSFGISKVELGTEFAYWYISESITFKLDYSKVDKWFDEFVQTKFHLLNYDWFMFSFLHEIGHHKTIDTISTGLQTRIDRKKDRYEKIMNFKFIKWYICPTFIKKKLENKYFQLYDEMKASRWAVKYYRTHTKEIAKMSKKLTFALHQFYKINNVTE